MKFFHISDLHLGIRVGGYQMLDDQRYILTEIIRLALEHKPDAVAIAGDVYDKSVPTVEAVELLDWFVVSLNELGVAVYLVAGNHDSTERISFASSLLGKSDVHISQSYKGSLSPIRTQDEYGEVNVWLMPYLKPSVVRQHFQGLEIASYSDAVSAALSNIEIDSKKRNVLVAHQFVTGAITSESDELYVGGSENVDASLFDSFDYVALGHLHRPQNIKRQTLRYSGTPLKYSLSEADHNKTVTLVEMKGKGETVISELPLSPSRDMREIRGTYKELTAQKNYLGTNTDDYVYICLTDEDEEPDAATKLRNIYPNLVRLRYDNARTQAKMTEIATTSYDSKEPVDLFGEFYEMQNGQPMSEAQRKYSQNLLKKIWEGRA